MNSKENIIKEEPENNGKETKKKFEKEKKIVRLLTVLLYLMAVSLPAVLLSSYYVFFWDSNERASHKPN